MKKLNEVEQKLLDAKLDLARINEKLSNVSNVDDVKSLLYMKKILIDEVEKIYEVLLWQYQDKCIHPLWIMKSINFVNETAICKCIDCGLELNGPFNYFSGKYISSTNIKDGIYTKAIYSLLKSEYNNLTGSDSKLYSQESTIKKALAGKKILRKYKKRK